MEDWKEITARWKGEHQFVGKNNLGGSVQMGDTGAETISPMELVLAGLAGCTGIDVVNILKKKRQNLTKFEIKVRGKRTEQYPKVYTLIEMDYLFWGDHLDPRAVQQAINLSKEKYCSVSAMLEETAKINVNYQIMDAELEK